MRRLRPRRSTYRSDKVEQTASTSRTWAGCQSPDSTRPESGGRHISVRLPSLCVRFCAFRSVSHLCFLDHALGIFLDAERRSIIGVTLAAALEFPRRGDVDSLVNMGAAQPSRFKQLRWNVRKCAHGIFDKRVSQSQVQLVDCFKVLKSAANHFAQTVDKGIEKGLLIISFRGSESDKVVEYIALTLSVQIALDLLKSISLSSAQPEGELHAFRSLARIHTRESYRNAHFTTTDIRRRKVSHFAVERGLL